MSLGKSRLISFVLIVVSLFAGISVAQQAAPRQRILQTIDNARLTKLTGNTHPLARAEFDRGRAPDSLAADRMLLLLSRTPEQESALAQLLDDQQTEGSANYHRWLTPEEFGQKFGAADSDIQAITAWLQTQGFQVNRIAGSKNVIEFSGTAAQVRNSFHTELHKYAVNGKEYWANAGDPQIPAALAPVVKGVVSLNNFPYRPQHRKLGAFKRDAEGAVHPLLTVQDGDGTKYYAVGPADFATIYKTSSLLSAGTNGTGQTIAIIGETNINLQDVTDFRTMFALSGGSTSVVIDGTDPGIVDGAETEALLDMEWAGAVAPGANLKLVSAQSTSTTAGIFLAANYAIQQNLAGVLSMSYGSCEANLGTGGNQFVRALWQQAAAQGITVTISSGDEGSAGCDYHGDSYIATNGLAVNGFASTPYNVAVGGTDFDDASAFSTYWNSTNNTTTLGSAKSYIPEMTWNETCAATATAGNLNVCPTITDPNIIPDGINVVAGSGGASNCSTSTLLSGQVVCQSGTPKPSWQSGTGVPADGVRDLPDVSLFASSGGTSSKSFYVLCEADAMPGYPSCQVGSYNFFAIGGTSASAPSFAGMVALFNQKAGTRLGNINYLLYSIAAKSGSSCTSSGTEATSCVFNDVVKGNISVPCVAGSLNCSQTSGTATGVLVSGGKPAFTTNTGYDLATGLGSVNAANLASAILTAKNGFTPTTTALTLNSGTTQVSAKHGDPINVAVNVTPTTATGPVAVQNSTGKEIDTATLVAGGSAWASTMFPGGTYTVKAHYPGDGTRASSDSNSVQVSISPEDSKTFLGVKTFDDFGNVLAYNAPSVAYGSTYILRMDVGDAAATLSNSTGVNSKCWMGTASCPTGTLTVTANGSPLDGGSFKLNSAGHAEDQAINLLPGTYTLAANYPGDASYNPNTAQSTLTVTKASANITFTPPYTSPLEYGRQYSFGVKIVAAEYGVAPSGTITVLDNGTPMTSPAVSNLSYSTYQRQGNTPAYLYVQGYISFQTIGDHSITVQYSGDSLYSSGTSASTTLSVGKAQPGIGVWTMLPNPTTVDIPVNLQFAVSGTSTVPTGTVTLTDNGVALDATLTITSAPGANSFEASTTLPLTSTGSHVIAVNYSGDANYFAKTQTLGTVTVYVQIPSTITSPGYSTNPTLVNLPVTLYTYVNLPGSGTTPQGTVTFYDNGAPLSGTVVYTTSQSWMSARMDYTFTTTGTHSLTASYSGDSATAAATSPSATLLSVVDKLPTSTSVVSSAAAVQNQPATLYAQVTVPSGSSANTPTMTGTVAFYDNGVELPGTVTFQGAIAYGYAYSTYTFTTTGTHTITANYSGDDHYASSQSATQNLLVQGPLTLAASGGSDYTMGAAGGNGSASMVLTNNTQSVSTVTVTCTVDSSAATCTPTAPSINLSPGVPNQITLAYRVPSLTAADRHSGLPWSRGMLFGGMLACCVISMRKRKKLAISLMLIAMLLTAISCGGGGNSGGGTPASKVYHFTVNASDGTNTATQAFTVTVANSF